MARPIRNRSRHSSSKVLSMSKHTRRRQKQDSTASATTNMLATVEQEMAQDYFEIEKGGISLTRLLCVYYIGARQARTRTMESLRSLLRLTPAH
jgi:hypothetical protein